MGDIIKIPSQVLQYLTCQKCLNFLSYGPIIVLANGRSICGRCVTSDSYKVYATLYTDVARYFFFPCMYWKEHCPRLLDWDEVGDHEKNCSYGNKCKTFFLHPSVFFKPKNTLHRSESIQYIEAPEELLPKLICSICSYYLSFPPIYVNKQDQYMCRRCYLYKETTGYVRHAALESLLQLLVFPCIYRNWGCPTRDRFGDGLFDHEMDCSYGHSYKKTPIRKTFVAKDGQVKERGLIESHRGYIWATMTPNSTPYGQNIKLTSQPSFDNNHIDPDKMQIIVEPSMLMRNKKNYPLEDDFDRYSIASSLEFWQPKTGERGYGILPHSSGSPLPQLSSAPSQVERNSIISSQISKVNSAGSIQSFDTNTDNEALRRKTSSSSPKSDTSRNSTPPKQNEQFYENLQNMYLNYGHPGVQIATVNRTGSFAESSIKPSKPLNRTENGGPTPYNQLVRELKIRNKLRSTEIPAKVHE